MKKVLIGGLLAASFVLVSVQSFAADTKPGEKKKSEDYGYKFDDDPLSAGGFGPGDARIVVRPTAARTTLIRPRTSFVPEMLKSVENI